jgi:hypothetical protein
MSLRVQIHEAIDDVTLPAPALESKITALVFAERRRTPVLVRIRRPSLWTPRFRGTATVIAALLVLALIAGLVFGGRLLRDLRSSPAPAINQGELKKLEARPLVAMPPMSASGECPVGPLSTDFIGNPAIGDGPMRTHIGMPSVYNTDWGRWNITYFVVSPTTKGLFLVRARDLQSGETVFFAGNISGVPDAQMGRSVFAGTIAGHDSVEGQSFPMFTELVVDASAPSDWQKTTYKAPQWGAYVGYPKAAGGCVFFQVDYDGATETYVYGY